MLVPLVPAPIPGCSAGVSTNLCHEVDLARYNYGTEVRINIVFRPTGSVVEDFFVRASRTCVRPTFFRSAATCPHMPAKLTHESTKHEGRKPRASERHVVGCCEVLSGDLYELPRPHLVDGRKDTRHQSTEIAGTTP